MPRKWILTLIGLSLLVIAVSACSASFPASADGNVTFVIPIQVDTFSKDATLSVRLWNAAQLAAADKISSCAVSYDTQTGVEEIQCPEGVEYQEVTPEELIIPIGDVGASITVTSTSIRESEKYRVQVSGLSSDDCNSASATVEGTAHSGTITLENLEWVQTLMACIDE